MCTPESKVSNKGIRYLGFLFSVTGLCSSYRISGDGKCTYNATFWRVRQLFFQCKRNNTFCVRVCVLLLLNYTQLSNTQKYSMFNNIYFVENICD
jgi:hypothetical protein